MAEATGIARQVADLMPESGGDDAPEQLDLLGGAVNALDLAVTGGDVVRTRLLAARQAGLDRRKSGRPLGARNRATDEFLRYYQALGLDDPRLALGNIVSTPIPALAEQLGMAIKEAADFWRKCAVDLLPYTAQRLPLLAHVKSDARTIMHVSFGAGGAVEAVSESFLDLTGVVIAHDDAQNNGEENQVVGQMVAEYLDNQDLDN